MITKRLLDDPYMKRPSYEIFMMLASILAIFNLMIYYLPGLNTESKSIVASMSAFLGVIFLIDFLNRFFTAPSKLEYMFHKFGWADFLSAIPFTQLNILRGFRIFRASSMMSKFGVKNTIYLLRTKIADTALYGVFFLIIVVIEFGAMAVLQVESSDPSAIIKTSSDAIWWAFVSITTVGYGDMYPVTNAGRLVGVVVLTVGVGLFGVVTGYLANIFLRPNNDE